MSELSPHPVPATVPLVATIARAPCVSPLGVWLRGRRPATVTVTLHGERRLLRIDGDLGQLLRHCSSIVVRIGAEIVAVSADELIRVRALRVVAGLPYLPTLEVLRRLFPDALGSPAGLEIPLAQRSAEEVLAACATARTPVLFSHVVYRGLKLGKPRWGDERLTPPRANA